MRARPGLSAIGFHHEAFFYAGEDEFLEGDVPYLEEGVAAGETVLVVLPEPRLRMIQESMGLCRRSRGVLADGGRRP